MKTVCIAFLSTLFCFGNLFGQKISQKDTAEFRWTTYQMEVMAPNDSLLVFDSISKKAFQSYKKKYHSKSVRDTTKITRIDSCMYITTHDSVFVFRSTKDETHDGNFYYLDAYIAPLSLYSISNIDTHNEVGNLILLDAKTNKLYYWSSDFDDPMETPLVSPKNNFIISIANNYYEDNECSVSIQKINDSAGVFSYSGWIDYNSKDWRIKDLVWINEHSFALNVIVTSRNEDTNETIETEKYLKVTFGAGSKPME